jgi:hypothetical protein
VYSIFGKGQQAVGTGKEWGCPVAYLRKGFCIVSKMTAKLLPFFFDYSNLII